MLNEFMTYGPIVWGIVVASLMIGILAWGARQKALEDKGAHHSRLEG